MTRVWLLAAVAASIAAWSPASWAQRQSATGIGLIPLSATGALNGVDMSGNSTTGTLTVGTPGGPETDIFSGNTSLASPFLAVSTATGSQGNITFNSSSTVYGGIGLTYPAGPYLLNISGGANGTVVNFEGAVNDTNTYVTGSGTLNFNSGSTNYSNSGLVFQGNGTIGLAANTIVVGALTTTAGDNTGTLVLNGGSNLQGAVGATSAAIAAINFGPGSYNTSALIGTPSTGAVHAYSFSLGTNELHIGGALTIAESTAGGAIHTTLASPTVYGHITPVGYVTIGPTITVYPTVTATSIIPAGTKFNIVQPQAGGTGSIIVDVLDPAQSQYQFLATTPNVAGQVQIELVNGAAPVIVTVPVTPVTPVPIAAPVVPVLLTGLPPLTPVLTAISALPTPAAVVNALAQLAPSTPDLAAPDVTFQGTRQFEDFWLSHLDDVMCGQVGQPARIDQPDVKNASCPTNDQRAGAWLKGFGYFGSQGAQNAFGGYNFNIYGTMVGYDAPLVHLPLDGVTRVGFGVGYARSTINGTTFSAGTNFNTYEATAYIAHENGPWFVDGDLSFGWNDYSGTRNISFPGINQTAQASYSGQDYTAFATTGYHFFARGFIITPLASLQYTHMDIGNYGETGAGAIDLNVQSQHYDFLESGLGVKVADPFRYRDGTYVPEVHFKWFHELVNPAAQDTAAFAVAGSPSFTTPGLRPAADTLDVGTGLTFLSCSCTARTWSVEGTYDFFWRSDAFTANQLMLRLTVRF
ncbi:MAG TPA: autotransporter domain-containing protein [Acetobacteraceae bacterium]|nr:autotransporter domain-containing protein [Acetobacteraceae bacterium]